MGSHFKRKKRTRKTNAALRKDELRNDFWLPKIKRRRRFSDAEIKLLEKEYNRNCNPNQDKLEQIADKFSTDKKIITTWFQNRRAKNKKLRSSHRREELEDEEEEEDEEHEEEHDFESMNDDLTEMSSENAVSSSVIQCYDNDTWQVMQGKTALTIPSFLLHQHEHDNVMSIIHNPRYKPQDLYRYFSDCRHNLYYCTKQDQDSASALFANNTWPIEATPPIGRFPEEWLQW